MWRTDDYCEVGQQRARHESTRQILRCPCIRFSVRFSLFFATQLVTNHIHYSGIYTADWVSQISPGSSTRGMPSVNSQPLPCIGVLVSTTNSRLCSRLCSQRSAFRSSPSSSSAPARWLSTSLSLSSSPQRKQEQMLGSQTWRSRSQGYKATDREKRVLYVCCECREKIGEES